MHKEGTIWGKDNATLFVEMYWQIDNSKNIPLTEKKIK